MTGVKAFIKDNIPEPWNVILRKNRCLTSFIEQFYQKIALERHKNKYHYKVSIQKARHYLRVYSINAIAIGFNFKEGADFWNSIERQITIYKYNCN